MPAPLTIRRGRPRRELVVPAEQRRPGSGALGQASRLAGLMARPNVDTDVVAQRSTSGPPRRSRCSPRRAPTPSPPRPDHRASRARRPRPSDAHLGGAGRGGRGQPRACASTQRQELSLRSVLRQRLAVQSTSRLRRRKWLSSIFGLPGTARSCRATSPARPTRHGRRRPSQRCPERGPGPGPAARAGCAASSTAGRPTRSSESGPGPSAPARTRPCAGPSAPGAASPVRR